MKIHKKYKDQFGLYHHKIRPNYMTSENSALFSAGVQVLQRMLGFTPEYLQMHFFRRGKDIFVTHINSSVHRFSHDNMTGIYCSRFVTKQSVKTLPLIKWSVDVDRNYWVHPRDIITYLIFKGNLIGYLLSPILMVIAMLSYIKPRENTSGKCKFFYVFGALLSGNIIQRTIGSIGLALGGLLLKKEHGKVPFRDVFSIYFTDIYHPINIMLGEFYAKFNTEDKST